MKGGGGGGRKPAGEGRSGRERGGVEAKGNGGGEVKGRGGGVEASWWEGRVGYTCSLYSSGAISVLLGEV